MIRTLGLLVVAMIVGSVLAMIWQAWHGDVKAIAALAGMVSAPGIFLALCWLSTRRPVRHADARSRKLQGRGNVALLAAYVLGLFTALSYATSGRLYTFQWIMISVVAALCTGALLAFAAIPRIEAAYVPPTVTPGDPPVDQFSSPPARKPSPRPRQDPPSDPDNWATGQLENYAPSQREG